MLSLESIQAIAAQSPTLAFAIAMLMLLNRNYMDGLRERKEWLQQLAWLIERYDGQLTASVEAITNVRNEVHYLRGEISKLITPISVWIAKNTEPKHDDRS